MITHREAYECIKKLSEYCDDRDCHNDCICCDIDCMGYTRTDKELRILKKEVERRENE